MTNEILPDKPSELIRLALHDLELCEQDDRYSINMGHWHAPSKNKCYVCLGGSVMAKSLNADILKDLRPLDCNDKTEAKLLALDEFITGYIYDGIKLLRPESFKHMRFDNLSDKRDIIPYEENPEEFKQQMHQLADDLEREGL